MQFCLSPSCYLLFPPPFTFSSPSCLFYFKPRCIFKCVFFSMGVSQCPRATQHWLVSRSQHWLVSRLNTLPERNGTILGDVGNPPPPVVQRNRSAWLRMKGVWACRSPSKHNKKQHSFQGEGSHGRVPHPRTHKAPAAGFLLTLCSSVQKALSWLTEALLYGTTPHILTCDQETPPGLDLSYLKFLLFLNILVKTGKDKHSRGPSLNRIDRIWKDVPVNLNE